MLMLMPEVEVVAHCRMGAVVEERCRSGVVAVSYTHLTLPTKRIV